MTNFIQRDQRRRSLFSRFEKKQTKCRAILQDMSIKDSIKSRIHSQINQIPRNSCKVRIRNRCVLTGRGRGVLKVCRMSRIRFRELASQGVLNGFTKASW